MSPVELTQACLDQIARIDQKLNSFITLTAEQALVDARRAEGEAVKGNWRGPLHGIPIALKDNIDTAGVRTTAASAVFADRVPTADADVVRRLKAAGAIVLGKLNMHEFALGTTSAISLAGPVRNPWDLDRIAGGSSGGSGAAVSAGLCFGAVGTDTGGSIRIPASCCGIVGLKPTFGVVSVAGTVPVSESFDHVGPMCRTVADTALMFRAMTDHSVATLFDPDAPSPVSSLRVGVLKPTAEICDAAVDPEVQTVFDAAVDVLRSLVADVVPAELMVPDLGDVIADEGQQFHAPLIAEKADQYDPRTRALLISRKDVSVAESSRRRQSLARYRQSSPKVFSRVDLVVVPTLPVVPLLIRDATDPFGLGSCTFAFSTGGWPSLSLPSGFSRSGLPIGLLISGPPLAEPKILALAQAYERITDWHRRRPPITHTF